MDKMNLVDGNQASLNFEPSKLQMQQVSGNTSDFPLVLLNTYDNTNGTLNYAAGKMSNFPSGIFTLVRVQFKAIAETNTTGITFRFRASCKMYATYGVVSGLSGPTGGIVVFKADDRIKTFLLLVER